MKRFSNGRVLPAFSVVRTDKHLYGFRGADGIWLDEALGIRETVRTIQTTDYGAVFVTNERLVGFASLLGDFSSKALGIHEKISGWTTRKASSSSPPATAYSCSAAV